MSDPVKFEGIPTISENVTSAEAGRKATYRRSACYRCHGRRAAILITVLAIALLAGALFLAIVLRKSEGEENRKSEGDQGSEQDAKSRGPRPNIVFVLADDLGYDDVSYHGNQIKTPNLDALCKDGVQLENYYVQPTCTPTRTQLLTGRYQIHLGLSHGNVKPCQRKAVALDETLLPQKMKEAGYNTHMIGKWHIGHYKEEYLPRRRGFDTFYGMLLGADDHYTHSNTFVKYVNGRRIDTPYLDLFDNEVPVTDEDGHYATHLFTEKAIDVINNQTDDQPFFLYVAYQAVHGPLDVPSEYEEMYSDIENPNRRKLAGMVTCLDEGVGNLTKAIKDRGLWNNTVFIFSSDNGCHEPGWYNNGRNWPLRGGKSTLFEGGIRAVAFVTGGYTKLKGVVNRELMHVSDWFPTLVSGLAGGHLGGTKPLDGFNQWDTISGKVTSPRKTILHNIDILMDRVGDPLYPDSFDTRVRAGLRVGEMKLLTGKVGEYRTWYAPPDGTDYDIPVLNEPQDKNLWLFNLTSDPNETTDLSGQMPDLVRSMLDLLVQFNETAVPPSEPPNDPLCEPGLYNRTYWWPWV